MKFLDRVIDINFYPTTPAAASNQRWRPVGLGLMGLQDLFFQLRLPFDSPEARELSSRIQEEIYFHALTASCDLAEKFGAHIAAFRRPAPRGRAAVRRLGRHADDTATVGALRKRIQARDCGIRC